MCTCWPKPRLWKTRDGRWICSVCHHEPPPPATVMRLVDFARDAEPTGPESLPDAWLDLREAV